MKDFIKAMREVIPKEIEVFERRMELLGLIHHHQPIGRRSLSNMLRLSEKVVRSETESLRSSELIDVNPEGMYVTERGNKLLSEMASVLESIHGIRELKNQLLEYFHCHDVFIVTGDVETNPLLHAEIGILVSSLLFKVVEHDSVIALTGGKTVASVVDCIKKGQHVFPNIVVVPARGSVRGQVEYQANTLAVDLAKKLGGHYQLINLPDNLSSHALDSVSKEPDIQEALALLTKSDVLIYGIGNAIEMADKRQLTDTVIEYLVRKNAQGEALGYYFNEDGEIVYTSRSIGIKFEQMTSLKYPIAVAAGKSKARAIIAVSQLISKGYLVIDEAAAREIIKVLKSK